MKIKEKLIFWATFTILGIISLQVPFSYLLGSSTKFTLFDFFAPIVGSFIGTPWGILSVFLMQLINFLIHGATLSDPGNIIRIFPTLFAVSYFARKRYSNIIIPALAMLVFNLHPIGRSAWQYSLLWLIPIAAHFLRGNLLLRSLGSTFTAHAVGGALWVWTFGLTRELWLSLIPIALTERMLFAGGITIIYILLINILYHLSRDKILLISPKIEKRFLLVKPK